MAVIRGPYVRLWFENCAENRKRCRTTREREDARGAGAGERGNLHLWRITILGITVGRAEYRDLVKWLKNFRLEPRWSCYRERERKRERGENPYGEIGYPRYFASRMR